MAKRSRKKHTPKKPVKKSQLKSRAATLALIGGLTAVVLAVIIGVSIYKSRGSQPVNIQGAAEVASLLEGIPQQNNILGQPNAPVTMIMFEDLKCPVCQKFTLDAMPKIINDYVRTGKLRIIFQFQTFVGRQTAPGDSERGARFALAAGKQNKLWNFTELFYHNQQHENERYITDDFLSRLGDEIAGLNVQQAFSQTGSDAVTQELNEQMKAWQDTGFKGVPSFQIGKTGETPTVLPTPTLDFSVFSTAIDNLL